MAKAHIPLVGKTFGWLTCLSYAKKGKRGSTRYLCKCKCGIKKVLISGNLLSGHTKSCGCFKKAMLRKKTGAAHPNWKGGRAKAIDGYIRLSVGAGKRCYEHTAVMEQHLGRKLANDETVHHKNGVRDDNRLENLELWTGNHLRGQRVSDRLADALSVVRRYAPELLKCEKLTLRRGQA